MLNRKYPLQESRAASKDPLPKRSESLKPGDHHILQMQKYCVEGSACGVAHLFFQGKEAGR